MYVVDIGEGSEKKEYHIKDEWEDFTIKDAIALFKVIKNAPKLLGKIYQATTSEDLADLYKEITHEHEVKTFPNFYGKMITAMSDIPTSLMKTVQANERASTYKTLCEKIVIGLIHFPHDFVETEADGFKWGDEFLYYPKTVYQLGEAIPLSNTRALEFTEVADIEIATKGMEGGKYEMAANIIAILCRPKDEKYDEQVSLKRAETMLDIPMPIMWNVFFWLTRYTKESATGSAISLSRQERRKLKRLQAQALNNSGGTDPSKGSQKQPPKSKK